MKCSNTCFYPFHHHKMPSLGIEITKVSQLLYGRVDLLIFFKLKKVFLFPVLLSRSLFGDKASKVADRTNEVSRTYAEQCVALAKELGLPSINLWSKMQETNGWQKKFLRLVIPCMLIYMVNNCTSHKFGS